LLAIEAPFDTPVPAPRVAILMASCATLLTCEKTVVAQDTDVLAAPIPHTTHPAGGLPQQTGPTASKPYFPQGL
jgi:hypothetical protein